MGTVSPSRQCVSLYFFSLMPPRLDGRSVILPAIRTDPSRRFHPAVDFLGRRRIGSSPQFIDPPQDFPNPVSGHGGFGHLERDMAAMRSTASSAGIAIFRKRLRPFSSVPRDVRCQPDYRPLQGGIRFGPNSVCSNFGSRPCR